MAEPAPTRRSSRTSSTPAQASSETLGASRAQLRRNAAGTSSERVGALFAAPLEGKQKDAATAAQASSSSLTELPVAPAPAAIELPSAPLVVVDPAEAATPVEAAPAPIEPPVAPLSRRARRAPAPLVESVLTPAEPFELLEPVVLAEAPVEAPAEAEALEVSAVAEPVVAERPSRRQRTPRPVLVESAPEVEFHVAPAETVASEPAQSAASGVDEFEAAARLFSFTGELAVQTSEATSGAEADERETADEPAAAHKAPRKARTSRGTAFKRVTAASFSVGVMGIVGLMTVGMTTPAEAVAAASGTDATISIIAPGDTATTELAAEEIQAYVAPSTVEAETLDRNGSYGTVTTAELASQAGIQNFSNLFHNDPNSAIQWPFAVGVTMSYGFGMRSGRMHEGIDFTPGAGSPIQAIADGTVRVASEAGGAYGVHVIIDHMIDGQLVSSHYAHMQYGSLQVVPGQKVTVGTVLGRTGNTGRSYGAHTHFEILMNGTTPIDPMPWLREHAGG